MLRLCSQQHKLIRAQSEQNSFDSDFGLAFDAQQGRFAANVMRWQSFAGAKNDSHQFQRARLENGVSLAFMKSVSRRSDVDQSTRSGVQERHRYLLFEVRIQPASLH